uniref:PsbB n=1 Tax=Rhodopseudomonas palustris TaxID=1076 RepID=Q9XDW4_RHOPL|nr:PsbB [Rhodopseudomonas palustris]
MTDSFSGQVVVVTGAASGIGAVIARHFAEQDATLVLSEIEGAQLTASADALAAAGHRKPMIHVGDLAKEERRRQADSANAVELHGSIDILVNNAGGGIIKPFLDHTPDTLRTTVDRNWTALWSTWHAVPIMKAKGYGRIVNIGADSVRNGLWDHAAYNAAKGGVHAMGTGLAREFATSGITVNVVAPCIVNTPQVQQASATVPHLIKKFVDVVPGQRPGGMDEIASVVGYLASKEASFVTGQVISVNGGSTML